MAELDTKPVTEPESLVPHKGAGGSMLERWVEGDSEKAVERINTMVRMLEALRQASIRATYPSDWILHVSRDKDGNIISQRGYLQDLGAERAGKPWGIEVGSPAIEEKQYPDGTFVVNMLAEAWSKTTGERLDYVEGSRWSGDKFFTRSVGPDEKIDPTDVRKSAYANLHGRAVRALSGLNGVPVETLKVAGLDVTKVIVVDYEKGAKGGESTGASVGTTDAVIPWGNAKGQKLSELSVKDLAYYLGAYEKDAVDPAKAKFAKANQRMLDALKAEQERRTRGAEQGAQTPQVAGEPGSPVAADRAPSGSEPSPAPVETPRTPTGRGALIGAVHAKLQKICEGDGKKVAALTRLFTRERGTETASLSDLTVELLTEFHGAPDEILKQALENAGKALPS
jgi:hypothetical protein